MPQKFLISKLQEEKIFLCDGVNDCKNRAYKKNFLGTPLEFLCDTYKHSKKSLSTTTARDQLPDLAFKAITRMSNACPHLGFYLAQLHKHSIFF